MSNKRVTRNDIEDCLSEVFKYLDLITSLDEEGKKRQLPSGKIVQETADTIETYLVRLKFNVWVRGLEGAEPAPLDQMR